MAGTKVRVAGPDLEAAEEARRRFEQGLVPNVQAPNPNRSVDGVEPAVEDISLAPESLDNTPEPTPEALYLPRKTTDWSARLNEARARGDDLRQGATIQRAGEGVNAAFVQAIGAKPSAGVADRMDKDSGIPETRVKEDMALEQAGLKRQKELDGQDPNSPANVAFRESFKARFPVLAQGLGPALNSLTQGQLEKMVGVVQKDQQMENTVRNAEARITMSRDQAEAAQARWEAEQDWKKTTFDELQRHNRATENIGWTNATRKAEELARYGGMSGIDLRKLQTNIVQLGRDSKPHAELTAGLTQVEKMLPGITDGKLPKDYPVSAYDKLNMAKTPGGSNLLKTREQQILQAGNDLQKMVAAARSGQTITDAEHAYYNQNFGSRVLDDPQLLANALRWFKGILYKKLETAQAAYSPVGSPALDQLAALPYFEQADGAPISYRDPFWKNVGGPGTRLYPDQDAPTSAPTAPAQAPAPAPQAANKPSVDTSGKVLMWDDQKRPVKVKPENVDMAIKQYKFEYRQPNQTTYGQP